MKTLMESFLTRGQTSLVAATLRAQVRASGSVEIPHVVGILEERPRRRVLDIGTGEGSFLLEVARRVRGTSFLGIDHNRFAIQTASARARRQALVRVRFDTAFFDAGYAAGKHDAIMTRYTLQHCSEPEALMAAVCGRLARQGTFIAVESVEDYMDCHADDPVWRAFRDALVAIHHRIGSNGNVGKALGSLFQRAGLRDVRVALVLSGPSTVGLARFRAVVSATAALGHTLAPDVIDRTLLSRLEPWLDDEEGMRRRDPYFTSAIACGTRR